MEEILELHNNENNNISQVIYGNVIFTCQNSIIYILGISSQFNEGEEKENIKLGFPKGKQEVVDNFIANPDIVAKNEVFEEANINLDVFKILSTTDFYTYEEKLEYEGFNLFKSTHAKGKTILLPVEEIDNLKGKGTVVVDKHSGNFRRVILIDINDIGKYFKKKQLAVIERIVQVFKEKGFSKLKKYTKKRDK